MLAEAAGEDDNGEAEEDETGRHHRGQRRMSPMTARAGSHTGLFTSGAIASTSPETKVPGRASVP